MASTQDFEALEAGGKGIQDGEEQPRAYRIVMSVLMLILFNMTLIAVIIGFYMYIESSSEKDSQSVMNGVYCVLAIALFVGLYQMGDLSKDNPHFYYI